LKANTAEKIKRVHNSRRVIPREGVESVPGAKIAVTWLDASVIPREGVESPARPTAGAYSDVIPREGVES